MSVVGRSTKRCVWMLAQSGLPGEGRASGGAYMCVYGGCDNVVNIVNSRAGTDPGRHSVSMDVSNNRLPVASLLR